MRKSEKILVAMSGGVDSSVSMILLKKQGFSPIGVTFKLVEGSRCCDVEAQTHAKAVCKRYGIPHYVFDVSKEFTNEVINYFIDELKNARTPNPCVICNRRLKFDQLLKAAKKLGASYVATGHYAKIRKNPRVGKNIASSAEYELLKGLDEQKDQSYYLSFLPKKWLSKIIFPLGNYSKDEVYKIAKMEGLDFLVEKKQSQDLCFIEPKLKGLFMSRYITGVPGDIVDPSMNILGKHLGIHNYTIGQRKGLNLSGGPYFVVSIDSKKNHVVVSKNEKDLLLNVKDVALKSINFIGVKPKKPLKVMAKIRYQQKPSAAYLDGNVLHFSKPQRAVTKGQIAVFYIGKRCLGGGIIK